MPLDPRFWAEVLVQALTLFVMLVGLAGLIIPVFPGLVVIWLAALFYALVEHAAGRMAWVDWVLFALITLLLLLGSVIDNLIIARRMRGNFIPWRSILTAFAAGMLASLFFTPLIGLVASPLTLFGMEYLRLRNRQRALASARAYVVAWGWSFAAVFATGALMLALWMLWAWL